MVTIRDVAKAAGVSVTTVSVIINGKAEERKISEATQVRVQSTMKELGYRPNLSARKLRSRDNKRPVIAFFWPLDYRIPIMASFVNAFQLEISRLQFDCELVVQTYENDHLDQSAFSIINNSYHGIMIGGTSISDIAYLEKLSPKMPLVLINRESKLFNTVYTNHQAIGFQAALEFKKKNFTEVAVISSEHSYVATGLRTQAFLYACSVSGINIYTRHIYRAPSTIEGGYEAAVRYLAEDSRPKAIFCDSDIMALGALSAFHEKGLRLPEDVSILSISMLGSENTRHSIPPLSVIEMPNDRIGSEIIRLLQEKIRENDLTPTHIQLDAKLILRESF